MLLPTRKNRKKCKRRKQLLLRIEFLQSFFFFKYFQENSATEAILLKCFWFRFGKKITYIEISNIIYILWKFITFESLIFHHFPEHLSFFEPECFSSANMIYCVGIILIVKQIKAHRWSVTATDEEVGAFTLYL